MKKNNKNNKNKNKTNWILYSVLIILSLVGIFSDSIVGNIVTSIAIFFVGWFYIGLLVILILTSLYLLITKTDFTITKRVVGIFLIVMAILCMVKFSSISTLTFNEVFTMDLSTMKETAGLYGNFVGLCIYSLFGDFGSYIVYIALIIIGIVLSFDKRIIDLFVSSKPKQKTTKTKKTSNVKPTNKAVVNKEAASNESKIFNYEDEATIKMNSIDPYESNAVDTNYSSTITNNNEPSEKLSNSDLRKIYNESITPSTKKVETEEVFFVNVDHPESSVDIKMSTPVTNPVKEEIVINGVYNLPPMSLLSNKVDSNRMSAAEVKQTCSNLIRVLKDFDIDAVVKNANVGPTVTQYEIELKAGTKVAKLKGITTEIALALAAKDVRIEAPIPGKSTIGIEIPNIVRSSVSFREVMSLIPGSMGKLAVPVGKDITNKTNILEINKTPHLLVAGSTGSGKSVCINGIICSILMRARPDEVKFVMVDPKKVELNGYNGIPHLLSPVVTDPKKASIALKNIVVEMEKRYDLFAASKTRNIESYNEYIDKYNETSDTKMKKLPYIVTIVDELADLMLVAKSEVEDSILRITQMARAAGIHLIIATQRPSTDVITGIIKANIPSRIAFAVASGIDSRTILNTTGAEKLIGKGDCLSLPMGVNAPVRLQGAYLTDEEINKIVAHVINEQKADYSMDITRDESGHKDSDSGLYDEEEYEDPLYNEIVEFAIATGKISASLVQRRFRLGYNRAARVIDLLEERGVCGPQNGSKPREVLISE